MQSRNINKQRFTSFYMSLFSKKKEVVDLRPRDSDMPIPAKMKERLLAGNVSNVSSIGSSATLANSEISSSGQGLFGFFGGSDSSSNSPVSSSTNNETPITETKTDFWGNPINNNTSNANSSTTNFYDDNSSHKISKMLDRLELIEKKLDRIERKIGIKTE